MIDKSITEKVLIGKGTTVIRFIGLLAFLLMLAGFYLGNEIGILKEKVGLLEDIVITKQVYIVGAQHGEGW